MAETKDILGSVIETFIQKGKDSGKVEPAVLDSIKKLATEGKLSEVSDLEKAIRSEVSNENT